MLDFSKIKEIYISGNKVVELKINNIPMWKKKSNNFNGIYGVKQSGRFICGSQKYIGK